MNNPIFTIVLPVYNAETWLPCCLDSLRRQTLADFELLAVEDGSTDGSARILDGLAAADRRIRVIKQENRGAGVARNRGLEGAAGKYVLFLDADDFFEPDLLAKSAAAMEECGADFVVVGSDSFNERSQRFEACPWGLRTEWLPSGQCFFRPLDYAETIFQMFNGWVWDKTYRMSFLHSRGLAFQDTRTTNDLAFVFSALAEADRVAVVPEILVHQRINVPGSLTSTRSSSWEGCLLALQAWRQRMEAAGVYEATRRSYANFAVQFLVWNLQTLSAAGRGKLRARLQQGGLAELDLASLRNEDLHQPAMLGELRLRVRWPRSLADLLNVPVWLRRGHPASRHRAEN